MNELHEKLLAQAHIEFAPDSRAVTSRFAELIVKECMKLCTEVKEDLSTIKDDDRRDLAEMSATFCYEAIKGEFGVEE